MWRLGFPIVPFILIAFYVAIGWIIWKFYQKLSQLCREIAEIKLILRDRLNSQ